MKLIETESGDRSCVTSDRNAHFLLALRLNCRVLSNFHKFRLLQNESPIFVEVLICW
ncbi:hypothetical protein JOY44_00575 [Phormidium sp. CLA17]|uniref:hypothetical protein n=1 Tax=Leptolyngbya sp. Cla-17 TaxID=2803751 RepID=UPI0019325E16|nr:hypothetical protein [Leptolyngbya sp. Cla-17]MBM0740150.1 hypothetical protein [Leptolyngbya sp. Cla-17]